VYLERGLVGLVCLELADLLALGHDEGSGRGTGAVGGCRGLGGLCFGGGRGLGGGGGGGGGGTSCLEVWTKGEGQGGRRGGVRGTGRGGERKRPGVVDEVEKRVLKEGPTLSPLAGGASYRCSRQPGRYARKTRLVTRRLLSIRGSIVLRTCIAPCVHMSCGRSFLCCVHVVLWRHVPLPVSSLYLALSSSSASTWGWGHKIIQPRGIQTGGERKGEGRGVRRLVVPSYAIP
jgi:hypothetical protein